MMSTSKTLLYLLLILLISNFQSFAQVDPPHEDCCHNIWSTGCWLGWSTTLIFCNADRDWWANADTHLLDLLDNSVLALRAAHSTCSAMNMAWDDTEVKARAIQQKRNAFEKNHSKADRRALYTALQGTENWGNQLKRQVYIQGQSRRETGFDTCAEKYYRLGYTISRAAQFFRQAVHDYENGLSTWSYSMNQGRHWLQRMQVVFKEYHMVRTGSCVDLDVIRAPERLDAILVIPPGPTNLSKIRTATDNLWEGISTQLYNMCSGRMRPDPMTRGGHPPGHTPPIDVTKAKSRDFVGNYYLSSSDRTHTNYYGYMSIASDGTFKATEYLDNRKIVGSGKWSFDASRGIFSIDWQPGGAFSGPVSGTTSEFTISGHWSNGTAGHLTMRRNR